MNVIEMIQILRSYCINFPILSEIGVTMSKPIALVFNEVQEVTPFINSLSPRPRIVDGSTKVSKVKELLLMANSDAVVLIMPSNDSARLIKQNERIELLFNAAALGKVDGIASCAAIFMVFNKFVLEEYRERVFEIHVSKDVIQCTTNIIDLIPDSKDISIVLDKIRLQKCIGEADRSLYAAVAFMYPKLMEHGKLDLYEALEADAKQLISNAKLYHENDMVLELCLEQMHNYICEQDMLKEVYELPILNEDAENSIHHAAYLKGNYVFVHDELFRRMMENVLQNVPMDVIKVTLMANKILCGTKDGYTTKMNYYSIDNQAKRVRMLKLDLDLLSMNGITTIKSYLKTL